MQILNLSALLVALCLVDNGAALKLNLTASCAGTQHLFCALSNISVTFDDPLLVLNSSAPQLGELLLRHVGPRIGNLPRELFVQAPQLNALLLHNCGLTRLSADDFSEARHLRRLVLQQNRLYSLPERVFSAAKALEELHLSHNTIHQLHSTAFAELRYLRYLDLHQNAIHTLPERLFADLAALRHIDLSANEIEKIDASTFAANPMLETILLADNKFAVFEPSALAALPHLHLLDVSANSDGVVELQLQSVDTLMAQNCGALERIAIAGSAVKVHAGNCALTDFSIGDKLAVRELDFHGNRLESFDDFNGLVNLQRLDVSKNHIASLTTYASPLYLPLPSLVHLNLASNRLQNLSADHFLLLQKLTHLDVAFNHLWQLDARLFEPLPDLEKLYIEGNRLHAFDYAEFLRAHAHLKELGVFANEWDFQFMRKMVTYLKDRNIELPVRFAPSSATLDLHDGTTVPPVKAHHHYASTTSVNDLAQQQLVGEVGGIHPYWTTRDVLALFTLIFVLLVLLLQLFRILQEERCLASCWRRSAAQVNNGVAAAAQHRPRRLNEEEDSEV